MFHSPTKGVLCFGNEFRAYLSCFPNMMHCLPLRDKYLMIVKNITCFTRCPLPPQRHSVSNTWCFPPSTPVVKEEQLPSPTCKPKSANLAGNSPTSEFPGPSFDTQWLDSLCQARKTKGQLTGQINSSVTDAPWNMLTSIKGPCWRTLLLSKQPLLLEPLRPDESKNGNQ